MSKIKILPEQLANQIAAGEVIERPASVVKELLENAIDAGAAQVAIQVEGAGTRLIRVIDDGEGMDEDDILLSLERHATSKLLDESQLLAIQTLGFRGEAIPSIASVSVFAITSRPAAAALGTRAEVRFGRLGRIHEMGCSTGTAIEVKDLFGNVPARRKFLKTAQTELSHIEEVVRNYGLAHPRMGLRYSANGRDVLDLPVAADTMEHRVRRLLGRPVAEPLIQVEETEGAAGVSGYLLSPEAVTSTGRLRLFVNGRPVRDRLLNHAVMEGLQNFLMRGRRPAGVLFLRLDPAEVDVNVHPAKQEVRFRQGQTIHHLLVQAVRRAMEEFQEQARRTLFGPGPDAGSSAAKPTETTVARAAARAAEERARPQQSALPAIAGGRPRPAARPYSAAEQVEAGLPLSVREPGVPLAAAAAEKAAAEQEGDPGPACSGEQGLHKEAQGGTAALGRCIGQVLDSYLLCEGPDGLVIIDQHAAHERLLFEKLKQQYGARAMRSQLLLFPVMLECTAEQLEACQARGDELAGLGVEVREFGGRSLVIQAVPAVTGHLDPAQVVREILDRFAGSGSRAAIEEILAALACKAAIKAGRRLEPEEMEGLVEQMRESRIFSHCPHGRPVLKHLRAEEIRRWFHRT